MIGRATTWLLAVLLVLAIGSTWRLDADPEGLQATSDLVAEVEGGAP